MAGSSPMDAACATYEGISFEHDIFPRTKEPVWILGKEYITNRGKRFGFFGSLTKYWRISDRKNTSSSFHFLARGFSVHLCMSSLLVLLQQDNI